MAMKIIVGIHNGATRSESVPILVNTLVVKRGGGLYTSSAKVTYKPKTSLSIHGSQNIIRKISLRRMRWEVHVARMGAKRDAYRVLERK